MLFAGSNVFVKVARQSGHERIAQMIEAKAESDASPLLAMPWEVVLHVLSFLDPYDLCVVAQACSVRAEWSFDSWSRDLASY